MPQCLLHTFSKISTPGLNISEKIDAVIYENKLLFFSFFNVRQFLDLSTFYREATDEDLGEFLNHATIYVSEPQTFAMNADSWVRTKVGILMGSGVLEQYSPSQVAEKAAEYGVNISIRDNGGQDQLVLPETKKDLKEVLRFLDEDYFSGPLTDNKYISNSKRIVV